MEQAIETVAVEVERVSEGQRFATKLLAEREPTDAKPSFTAGWTFLTNHARAMLFIAAMLVHMMRVFLTGAFRKPRELNWVIGCLLLFLGTLEGFTGYSLPDDLLSGTGIRAADGFVKSIPVIGTYGSFFLFGGEFPGDAIIPRLYAIHILLILFTIVQVPVPSGAWKP